MILALSVLPLLPYNWLPPLFNIFEREFGANLEEQGRTLQYFFASGLLIVVIGGWLTKALGIRGASSCAMCACAAGLLLIGISRSFGLLLAGCAVYGFGTTWMYLIYGVFVSRYFVKHRQKAFLINNMVLAMMGGTGPMILGFWLSRSLPWRSAFLIAGALNLAFGMFILFYRGYQKVVAAPAVVDDPEQAKSARPSVLFAGGMWLIGLAYVLHGIAELGIISWVGKLYYHRLGITEPEMAFFISVNVISFALGRFLLTFIAGRFRDLTLLGLCAGGGTLFFVLIFLTSNYTLGLIWISASGIFMSGNAPAMNSYMAHRFAGQLELSFAIYQGFGALGSALAPPLIGFVGDRTSLETAVWLIPLGSGALSLLAFCWSWFQGRKQRAELNDGAATLEIPASN
jgi:FHS family glucose/mannose:H+ symporter-like MFS transporter